MPDEVENEMSQLRISRSSITLRQQVVEVLRRAIIEEQFKPGERLIERELCIATGVSRTSVREALRHLETEGLVHTVPNRGPIVAELSIEEARQIYQIRAALESLVVRLFTEQASSAEVAALQRSLIRLRKAFAKSDRHQISQRTTELYEILFKGCGNPLVAKMIRSLQARVVALRWTSISHAGRAPASLAEMETIVAAIARRDAREAEEASLVHVQRASEAALAELRSRSQAANKANTEG
jgi:DNA-binding GntR family transcriptional regulator